jgi:hypothetical protein
MADAIAPLIFDVRLHSMRLTIKRLWEDSDGMLQLDMCVANEAHCLSQDFYAYPEDIARFGAQLEGFPTSATDTVVFEYGSTESKIYCWVRLKAYCYNLAGHSALEFSVDNNREPPDKACGVFSVKLEAASLNALGTALAAWAKSGEDKFEFEAREA